MLKRALLRRGRILPEQLGDDRTKLTGSVEDLLKFIQDTLKLGNKQLEILRPAFETLARQYRDTLNAKQDVVNFLLDQLAQKGIELKELGITVETYQRDELTYLPVRRVGDQLLQDLILEEHRRTGFAFLLSDINQFKRYNDSYDWSLGNLVLLHSALNLRRILRGPTSSFRWSGDEFGVIFPEVSGVMPATIVGQRYHNAIEKYEWAEIDPRLAEHPPRVNMCAVHVEIPSEDERYKIRFASVEEARLRAEENDEEKRNTIVVKHSITDVLDRFYKYLATELLAQAKKSRASGVIEIPSRNIRIKSGRFVEV